MKNGKRPTRAQKILMSQYRMNSDNWLVVKENINSVTLVHRHTSNTRVIMK